MRKSILNYLISVLTITPVVKKMLTAVKDLLLNLGNPHKPWPLVHPLLSLVPNPTKRPAIAKPMRDVPNVILSKEPNG